MGINNKIIGYKLYGGKEFVLLAEKFSWRLEMIKNDS